MNTTTADEHILDIPRSDVLTLDAPPAPHGEDENVVDVLVACADFVRYQMQVAFRFTPTRDDARRIVLDVFDTAYGHGVASRAAVGAVALLAELARVGDVEGIARTIVDARHQFGDEELLSAGVALITAWSEVIAVELALDSAEVHAALCSVPG